MSLDQRTPGAIYSSPRKSAVHFLLPNDGRGGQDGGGGGGGGGGSSQGGGGGEWEGGAGGGVAEEKAGACNLVTAVVENAPNISPGKVETRLTLLSTPGEGV